MKKISTTVGILFIISAAVILFGGVFAYQYYTMLYSASELALIQKQEILNKPFPLAGEPAQTTGWQTYTNAQDGFTFQYPVTLNTKYANFSQTPAATVYRSGDKNIDSKGCYTSDTVGPLQESETTIGTMQFCLAAGGSPGAGQLYNSYYYTTLNNGNYITLAYVVHTLNGCDPYMGTPDYQPCTNLLKNYDSIVMKPIEESVATLTFTNQNQVGCTADNDCPKGDSCVTQGPLVAHQPVKKVCVPPGHAVSL